MISILRARDTRNFAKRLTHDTDDGRFWISVRRNSKLTRTTARAAELTIIVAVDYGTIKNTYQ
jgi:hypothetical protein